MSKRITVKLNMGVVSQKISIFVGVMSFFAKKWGAQIKILGYLTGSVGKISPLPKKPPGCALSSK